MCVCVCVYVYYLIPQFAAIVTLKDNYIQYIFSCLWYQCLCVPCVFLVVLMRVVTQTTVRVHWMLKCFIMLYKREKEKFLFNDALNTFYLRLYGVRHMVKDHSDSEKGNPLPPHRLLLSINSKVFFICTIPQTG